MDLEEAITVTKLNVQSESDGCYLLIGWQVNSFEMYLFNKDKLWKGRFSANRLAGFSRNLHLTEQEYYNSIKRCLSRGRDDYYYQLKSDFFYWKRQVGESLVIEGFLPMEEITTPQDTRPNLIEVLVALNSHLKDKINGLKYKFETIKSDYQKCLKDTEEFLNLKIDMEKALCKNFMSLLNVKKFSINDLEVNTPAAVKQKDDVEAVEDSKSKI